MAMQQTLKSISTALELIDGKKENLRKAFEDLRIQSLSSSSSAFNNLKWEDLDSHFTSIQSDLLHKFSLLQSIKPAQPEPQLQSSREEQKPRSVLTDPVHVRPELKLLFENMDGFGLRNYILDHPKERAAIRAEISGGWKYAPDPAKLVIDAMHGYFRDGSGSDSDSGRTAELGGLRRACLVLLEEFMKATVGIGVEARERARALAAEWKRELVAASGGSRGVGVGAGEDEEENLEKLGFLHLLAAFGLMDNGQFDMNELIEFVVVVARHRQAVELCRLLGIGDRIADVVEKLIGKGKQLLAVKFIFQFGLTEKFPPVPLLKTHVSDSKKLAQDVQKNGKNSHRALNEAAAKEISSLKSVIKVIEDHNLESEYPKDDLLKSVEKLEKEKTFRKRAAAVHVPKGQQPSKQLKQRRNMITQKNGAAGLSAIHKNVAAQTTFHPIQQSHAQNAGLFAHAYLSSPAVAYGSAGHSAVPAPHVAGISAGMHSISGAHTGYSVNVDPSMSNLYPPESQTQPIYYDRSLVYRGYDVPPQYHPSYYP